MSKKVEYKEFQQKSIEAICKHFENHNRALCADEAGLGKTYIARGVIERLARQKIEAVGIDKYQNGLKTWWEAFCENAKNEEISTSCGGKGHHKYEAIKRFIYAVTAKEFVKTQRCWKDALEKDSGVGETIENIENTDQIIDFLVAMIEMYTVDQGQNVTVSWKIAPPLEISFRVLYVCCNLAIADQNTSKLVPIKQRSHVSAEDKPDRLSVLGYYLDNYPTPYIEIFPITATISKTETPGNKNEKRIVMGDENTPICPDKRKEKEEESLEKLNPDLIIFDEFQNYGDMIHLIDAGEDQFKVYLESIDSKQDEEEQDVHEIKDNKGKGKTSNESRKEALERCRRICNKFKNRKLLFLSATPFHTVSDEENDDNINRIDMQRLLEFLCTDSYENYCEAIKNKNYRDAENVLYKDCGIFRNERVRLMKKNNMAYHLIQCSGEGLLERAMDNGNCAGTRAKGIVETTPDFSDVEEIYQAEYAVGRMSGNNGYKPSGKLHSRYKRLTDIIYASDADDITETDCKCDASIDELKKLLWIPPVEPSVRLQGVFAKYKSFSKSLVFSNLLVTPYSVCKNINNEAGVQSFRIGENDEEKVKVKDWLLKEGIFESDKTANSFIGYLVKNGKAALCNNGLSCTADEIINYCIAGALKDVICEYKRLGFSEKDIIDSFADKYCSFAYAMDMADLSKSVSGASVRKSFNSPFYPFVLMTTSIGSEGLDFHLYCNRLIHYTVPSSVAQLEQKNGRIDRKDSLAQRRWWAKLPNKHFLEQYREQLEKNSGGMIPDWDAGENNLHYYFLYTRFTREKDKIADLLKEKEKYRASIGTNMIIEEKTLNLCPYLHP